MANDLINCFMHSYKERAYRLDANEDGSWNLVVDGVPTERLRTRDDVLAAALRHAAAFGSEQSHSYKSMTRIENWTRGWVDNGSKDLTQ
jgi:hypothetical protein